MVSTQKTLNGGFCFQDFKIL